MELRQLKTFQTVARLLSFHRAAEVLNYAPSTVSTQIRLLEEELGVPIFDRLGKNIRLTSAGQMLVQYSKRMLDIEKETLTKIMGQEEPQGKISIRIPQSLTTYLLPSVLIKFQADYPKLGFDICTCGYEILIHELKTGMIDIAFLLANDVPFSELKVERLRTEDLVLVSSPDHHLAQKDVVHLSDLTNQSVLLPKHDCSYRMQFEQMLTEEKVGNITFYEMNSVEAIKQCVFNGLGVAMLPTLVIKKELAQNKLTILPWFQETIETAILMLCHKGKWLSPALKSFMHAVREVFRAS